MTSTPISAADLYYNIEEETHPGIVKRPAVRDTPIATAATERLWPSAKSVPLQGAGRGRVSTA